MYNLYSLQRAEHDIDNTLNIQNIIEKTPRNLIIIFLNINIYKIY